MAKQYGRYTVLIIRKSTKEIVQTLDYVGQSGNSMMDEVKYLRTKFPPSEYIIEW